MTRILLNLVIAAVVIIPLVEINNRPYVLSPDFVADSDQFFYDLFLRDSLRSEIEDGVTTDPEIVIVNIDREAIQKYGDWPWRRDRMAKFVKFLVDNHEARLVVLPEHFQEKADDSSVIFDDLREIFYYDEAVLNGLDKVEGDFNFDNQFLDSLDGRPVIIGYSLEGTDRKEGQLPVSDSLVDAGSSSPVSAANMRGVSRYWSVFNGWVGSGAPFLERSWATGFTNFKLDSDGNVRRMIVGASVSGDLYLSLPMVVLSHFDDPRLAEKTVVAFEDNLSSSTNRLYSRIGNDTNMVGISGDGEMLLKFRSFGEPYGGEGAGSYFTYVSALDIMDGRAADLKDKVVLVGSDAEEINDIWRTPVNAQMPGVELYATALRNLRDGTLHRPHDAWLYEVILLVVIGLVMAVTYPFIKLTMTLGATVVGMVLSYYVVYHMLWQGSGEVYRLVPFLALFVVMLFSNLILRILVEYREKVQARGVLTQYIPPTVARKVSATGQGLSMEGRIRELSILFSDVRGFTSISERFKPEELTKFMNMMLTTLSKEIHNNEGTIDKYIGDAVMAFWNDPLDDPHHAANAVRSALAMQSSMRRLSAEIVAKGYPELKMGVGINTGEACVGNMGSEIRLAYTVMGDAVNLAARLEGVTKKYGVDILVGEKTYEQTKDEFIYRPVDSVRVKGKQQAVTIYEPLADARSATAEVRRLATESVAYWDAYRNRRFEEMAEILRNNLVQYPDDGLMQLYLSRASQYLDQPPSNDWEPVTNFETK